MTTKPTVLNKEKEVYNTQAKEITGLPTITIIDREVKGTMDWAELSISVSDTTAKGALVVFKDVAKQLGLEIDE